jgi:hypothetical protein
MVYLSHYFDIHLIKKILQILFYNDILFIKIIDNNRLMKITIIWSKKLNDTILTN